MTIRVITFGTYDLLHVGHINLFTRARALGDQLIVGVSTDDLNVSKKGRLPVDGQDHRLQTIGRLACVDEVFLEHSLEAKREYIVNHRADIFVMGDDWQGRFDDLRDIVDVVYLPRTPGVSTTDIIRSRESDDE